MIRVNNREQVEWREGMTVSELLEHLNYTYHSIIVKVNGDLVPRGSHDTYVIPDESNVKAIHLIAGG